MKFCQAVSVLAVSVLTLAAVVGQERPTKRPPIHDGTSGSSSTASHSLDEGFTTSQYWNDGQAEVSVFDLDVEWQLPSGPLQQKLRVLILLVKHDVEARTFAKDHLPRYSGKASADEAIPAFQWQALYDVADSRRSRIFTARQRDLRPLEQSFGSISWEGNCHLTWHFSLDEKGFFQRRCFSGTPRELDLHLAPNGFTALQVPLLIRALDFSQTKSLEIAILAGEDQDLTAQATFLGQETLDVAGRKRETEKIEIRYSHTLENPGALLSAVTPVETYWRGVEDHRPLLRLEGRGSESLKYEMVLAESFRAAWWEEDIRPRLRKLGEVPGVRPQVLQPAQ